MPDAFNRVAGALYVDGTRVTNTFDPGDRPITVQDMTGVTALSWDRRSLQVGVVNGIGKALTYSLDPAGNGVGMVDSAGGVFTYTVDQQNRLVKLVNPFAETTTVVWDALDREAQPALGNGVAISHAYGPAGRETVLGAFASSGAAIAVYSATYDQAANRLSVLELDGTRRCNRGCKWSGGGDARVQPSASQGSAPGTPNAHGDRAQPALGNLAGAKRRRPIAVLGRSVYRRQAPRDGPARRDGVHAARGLVDARQQALGAGRALQRPSRRRVVLAFGESPDAVFLRPPPAYAPDLIQAGGVGAAGVVVVVMATYATGLARILHLRLATGVRVHEVRLGTNSVQLPVGYVQIHQALAARARRAGSRAFALRGP